MKEEKNSLLNFKPEQLTAKEKYKIMVGSVIPRPIALVSSQSDEGLVNIAPFSYFNLVTYRPPIVSVSVQRVEGEMKDTARNILKNHQAVVHVVSQSNVEEANKTSAPLGPEESELDLTNFTLINSQVIDVPGVEETKVRFETELFNHVVIEENGIATADLLLLKVVHYSLDEHVYDVKTGYVDADTLAPVSRLAGNDYAKLGETFELIRPT